MDGLFEKILSSNQISPKKFDKILCEVLFLNKQNAIEPYPIEVIPGGSELQSIVILFKCPHDICEHLVKIQNKVSKRKSIIPKEEDITSEEKSDLNVNIKAAEDSNNHANESNTNTESISYTPDNEQIVSRNDVHTSEKNNKVVADTSQKSEKDAVDISHKSVKFKIDETNPDGKTDSNQQKIELQAKVSNKDESKLKPKQNLKNMPEQPPKERKKGKFAFGKLNKVAKDNTPKTVPWKLSDSTKKGGDNTESSEAFNVNKTPTDSVTSKKNPDELDTPKKTQDESGTLKEAEAEDNDKEHGKLETEVDKTRKKVSDQHADSHTEDIESKSSNGNTESSKDNQKEKVEILEKDKKENISTEKKQEDSGYAKGTNEEEEEEEDNKAQSQNVRNKEIEIEKNELASKAVKKHENNDDKNKNDAQSTTESEAGDSPDVMKTDLENKNSEISSKIEKNLEETTGKEESAKIENDINDNIDDVATQNNGVTPQENDVTSQGNEVDKEEERGIYAIIIISLFNIEKTKTNKTKRMQGK